VAQHSKNLRLFLVLLKISVIELPPGFVSGRVNQLIIVTLYSFDIVTFVVMQSIVQRQKLMLRTTSGDVTDLPTKNETLQKTGTFLYRLACCILNIQVSLVIRGTYIL
jgi:hypothetical protein